MSPPPRVPGGHRTNVLKIFNRKLGSIPGVGDVYHQRTGDGHGSEIVGELQQLYYADGVVVRPNPKVVINWYPQPAEPAAFKFHYRDDSGYDCGYHRHANSHVPGRSHFQYRLTSDDEYTYEAVTFEANNPVGLMWEIVDERLRTQVAEHYQ